MGFVLQMQRRAIEALRDVVRDGSLPPIDRGITFLSSDGSPFFPLGISVGIGTCSDIHGMNVLVLHEEGPACWQQLKEDAVVACEYAVLLLSPTERERQNSTLCVERLRIVEHASSGTLVFSKTGIKEEYVKI